MTTSVSDKSTSGANSTSRTSETGGASRNVAASLDRDMARVSTRDVNTEAARVTRGEIGADTIERTAAAKNPVTGDRELANANPTNTGTVKATADQPAAPGDPIMERGANGEQVEAMQQRLTDLGYDLGGADGDYGRRTQSAVRQFQLNNDLPLTGKVDQATLDAINGPNAKAPDPNKTEFPTYPPGSPEQIALFQEAARAAGLPEEWASSPGLINLLQSESGGQVGKPNYTYGSRQRDPFQWADVHEELRNGNITAESSATGLGQLLLSNVDKYYPSGRNGIGNPQEEAIGMLRYIQDRYGTPDEAWAQYNQNHEGY